jgi:hypothetical protein
MICEACHGTGRRLNPVLSVDGDGPYGIRIKNPDRLRLLVPCDECGGSGFAHCCEGEQAQPPG